MAPSELVALLGGADLTLADEAWREPSAAPQTYPTAGQRFGFRQLSRSGSCAVPTPAPAAGPITKDAPKGALCADARAEQRRKAAPERVGQ